LDMEKWRAEVLLRVQKTKIMLGLPPCTLEGGRPKNPPPPPPQDKEQRRCTCAQPERGEAEVGRSNVAAEVEKYLTEVATRLRVAASGRGITLLLLSSLAPALHKTKRLLGAQFLDLRGSSLC
jgi:hypothetical protein